MKTSETKNIQSHSRNTMLSAVHLAPYLPYELKCLVTDKGKSKIGSLFAVYDNGECSFYDTIESEKGFSEVQPILRPISDLLTTIVVGDEEFNPLEKICKTLFYNFKGDYHVFYVEVYDRYVLRYSGDFFSYSPKMKTFCSFLPEFPQYDMVQKLFEWHFDVFGLIEKGLAIDVNTLSAE